MPTMRGYKLPVNVLQSAASVANTVVWSMRNLGNRVLLIRRLIINAQFAGTPAATQSAYSLLRFRTATPTGGTALTPVKRNNDAAASSVTDARFLDTGLTMGAATFDTPFITMGAARGAGSSSQYVLDWPNFSNETSEPFTIKPQDGLCLRLDNVAVIGDGIMGAIGWDEYGGQGGN